MSEPFHRRASMIPATCLAVAIAGAALAPPARAVQDPVQRVVVEQPVEQRIARLIARLGKGGPAEANAIGELRVIGEPAVRPLMAALERTAVVDTARVKAILAAFQAIGPRAAGARSLLQELASPRNDFRRAASRALRSIPDPDEENTRELVRALTFGPQPGLTLIADYSRNRILEVDGHGKEVFALEEMYGAWDVERLPNDNLLVAEFALNRVVEVTRQGEQVWVFESDADGQNLKNPYDADRLPNGDTLIADTFGGRVLEVDRRGVTVWQFTAPDLKPYDVNRLPNGNTLIADGRKERIIEVDPNGKIVWELDKMPSVHDVDRLPNGNTLVTQRTLHRVVEVDRAGNIVFRLDHLSSPSDADRLPNGNTLVAENGHVREFDPRGRLVWQRKVAWSVEVNRYY